MVGNDIHRSWRTFKVVTPAFECFEDGQEFFVVDVIVQLCRRESPGVKRDRMYLIIGVGVCGQYGAEGIVSGVGLNNERRPRDPLFEDWSSCERFLECFERSPAGFGEIPRSPLTS